MIKFLIICVLSSGFLISGCASVKETTKCIVGVSTKVLEDGRKNAIRKTFEQDIETCYTKVRDCLKSTGSYIYAEGKSKELIAIYLSEKDTTPVGVFFTKIDGKNTEIEVSSPSTYAKETVATRIFNTLEGKPAIKEEEGEEGNIWKK